ncbi:hypothetical protein BDR22DRAFT_883897 [Usnea florida]
MPSFAGQDGTDGEKETQTATTSPVGEVADNANIDNSPTEATDFATGWRFVAIASAIVMSLVFATYIIILPKGLTMSRTQSIVATATPHITDYFHSLNDVGWYASAFFINVAATQLVSSKAFKYLPMQTLYLLNIPVFELGRVSPNSTIPIVGQAITDIAL